jgi:hypothetical protein
VTIGGLEPGSRYTIRPIVGGVETGDALAMRTLQTSGDLLPGLRLEWLALDRLSLRFRQAAGLAAAVATDPPGPGPAAVASSIGGTGSGPAGPAGGLRPPSGRGAPDFESEALLTGLDPDRSHRIVVSFDGLDDRVVIDDVRGPRDAVLRVHARLRDESGRDTRRASLAERLGRLARTRAGQAAIAPDPGRVREEVEAWAGPVLGAPLHAVLAAAAVVVRDSRSDLSQRWRAVEVIDEISACDLVAQAFCGRTVLEADRFRSPLVTIDYPRERVPPAARGNRLEDWIPQPDVRALVRRQKLSLWTGRDTQLPAGLTIELVSPGSEAGLNMEARLAGPDGWPQLVLPAPPVAGPAGVDLYVRVANLTPDKCVWLMFSGTYRIAVRNDRAAPGAQGSGIIGRKSRTNLIRVRLPAAVVERCRRIGIKADGFDAAWPRSLPSEMWVHDMWFEPAN